MKDPLIIFGEQVKRLRKKKNLSQEDLADLAGFDRTYVSLIERGKRNLSLVNLCKFARALNVKPFILIKKIN